MSNASVFLNPTTTAEDPFDQDLNTDDAVSFASLTVAGPVVGTPAAVFQVGSVSPDYDDNAQWAFTKLLIQSGAPIGLYQRQEFEPPTNGSYAIGRFSRTGVPATSTHNLSSIYGSYELVQYKGLGTATRVVGSFADVNLTNNGNVSSLIGNRSRVTTSAGGLATSAYAYYAEPSFSVSPTNYYGVWTDAAGGVATNPYAFWSDETGVFNIKADNTFDSVYQAIPALYNPQFTKYTPGLANYERIVQQWNGNVAEIGTEKGGSGTQRNLKLLGPVTTVAGSLAINNTVTSGIAVASTHRIAVVVGSTTYYVLATTVA